MNFKNVKFVKLGSITKWTSGGTPSKKNKDFWDGRIPWISARNLKSNFIYSSDITISELGLNNGSRLAPVKSILLLVRGSGLFNDIPIGLVEKEVAFNQDLKCIQADSETVLPEYIFYWLLGSKQLLRSILEVTGIGAGKFDTKLLQNLEIPLPSIEEQELIVKLCDSISRKIEINERISQLLENMAQAIFKQWFVDFEFPNEGNEPYKSSGGEMIESDLGMIPKGWEVRTVDDITAKFTTGLNPRKNFVLGNGNNFYVTIKNMGNQRVFLDDRCDKIDDQALVIINKRSDLRKGDVLFSGIGTIGRTYLIDTIPKNWNISESIFTLRAYDERVSLFLYQLLLSESFQGYAKQLASGSVQKGIRMGDMKIFKFAYSESVVINNYHKIMSSVIDKIKVLQRENTMLSNLRETLLPKLMSGEIRVPLDKEGDAS